MQQYCIYLRKSRADLELEAKGEMETLARHEKSLFELSRKMNLSITQVYREIVSGETIAARPVVQQLLDEVEQGKWTGVLVMEIERLARGDTIDQGVIARAFKFHNTKIITPAKIYDPSNEFDEEYFEFGLFMSRREYKTINRRIQRGRVASAKDGKFVGSTPPYGYDKVRIEGDKGYTLATNAESDVVKLIYDLYLSGNGMTLIATKLDDLGIKPRNRDSWSRSTINDILQNPVYTGKIRWSYRLEKDTIIDGELCKRRTVNSEPILVDGLHPALISQEVFDKAQKIRKSNTHKSVKKELQLQNPLSGIVYCKLCGALMTRLGPNKRNKYDALKCPNRYCNNVSAPIYLVERKLIAQLREWLRQYKIELENERVQGKTSDSVEIFQKALKELQAEVGKIDKQVSNTFDLLEQGIYTAEVFTQRNRELADRKEKTLNSISDIERQIEQNIRTAELQFNAIPRIEKVLEKYEDLQAAEDKNKMLHNILSKVEYIKKEPNRRGNLDNDNFELHVYPKLND